jgi:ribose transport system permease protein
MSVSTDKPVTGAGAATEPPASTHTVEPAYVPAEQRFPLLGLAERYALLLLTAGICLYFSVAPASSAVFASLSNVNVVLGGQTAVLMIAIAAVFPLVAGHIDFSLGATTAASMVLAAGLMSRHDVPLPVCVVACFAFGAVVGLVNGVAVTGFGMNPFVTTLGVATLLGGGILWYTDGQTIFQGISPDLRIFGSSTVAGLPQVTAVVAVVALVAWYVLTHTPFGRSLYAIGSNHVAARLVGLRVGRNVLLAFVISGTIAGAAGVLQLSRTGSATSDSGTALLFPALAAVFLGATAIRPGFFNVVGTVIGALFVSFSVSGLTISGADTWVSPVFNGVALLVAVGLSTWLGARRRARG